MPMILRENRRSLHLNHNSKFSDITKETIGRPRSWYLPGPAVDIDPYTSVRKIFYEFPKRAFYGDENISPEKSDKIIVKEELLPVSKELESLKEVNLRNSFTKLDLRSGSSSPVPSIRSIKSMDTNNNSVNQSNKGKSNMLSIGYFSSKTSDTASLKEESSNYADIYVPNAKPPSTGFLRRSHKRRSYDSSKAKDLVKRLDDEVSVSSLEHSFAPKSNEGMDSLPKEQIDPQILIDRYLRDANKDICEGVYPAADDSISVRSDPICLIEDQEGKVENFIPWTKRLSFIEANWFSEQDTFKNRRGSKRFSSLRRQKSFTLESKTDGRPPTIRRAHTTLNTDSLRSTISKASSLRRQHSEVGFSTKKRKMSTSSSVLNRNSTDFSLLPRDGPRALRQSRHSNKLAARYFFENYQDKLREEIFSIEFPSIYDPTADPCHDQYISLSKEFGTQILSKTYQHLLYVRSRLSESARKTQFQCDGCFGCASEYERTSVPQWV